MNPGKTLSRRQLRRKLICHVDFGPGHLPTSASQGIDSTHILAFWDRSTNDKRAILEQTLRDLPLTHFSCLERVLQQVERRPRMGTRYLLDELTNVCSPERFKACLMILTTPGRDYRVPISEIEYPVPAIGDEDLNDSDWKSNYCHNEDSEAKEEREALARAREHAAWIRLQKAVQSLPLDLKLLIRDTLLEGVFGPGREIVYPYEEPTYLGYFRALDRRLYDKYSHIYYCQNTWVIAEGSASWLIEYNHFITPEVCSKIRNITLRWTWRDAMDVGPIRPDVEDYIDREMKAAGAGGFDNWEIMGKYYITCPRVEWELEIIWLQKSREIGCMQLDNLVIDAREAFAPDGKFLGLEAARCWAVSDKPPYYLEVWAPNRDNYLADQMLDIVSRRYL